jgi:hypothetical protein
MRGRVSLVITSPPYGPSTHGHVRTPGPRRGKVRKIHHRYGGADNLAYRDHNTLAEGFTEILAGCRAILCPGGHVAITARPYRRHGELIDIPGMVVAAGEAAGLQLAEECVALMAGVRDGLLVPRASFFQQKNVRDAIADGDPQWLVQHEDVVILRLPQPDRPDSAQGDREYVRATAERLDAFAPPHVHGRVHPTRPTDPRPDGNVIGPRPHPGRDVERTTEPCPPHEHPKSGDVPPTHRWSTDPASPSPADGSATAGRR